MSTQHTCINIGDTAMDIAHTIVELFDESDQTEQFVPYGKYMLTFKGSGEPERFDINVYSAVTERSFDIDGWLIPDSGGLNLIDFVEDIGYIVAMLVEAERVHTRYNPTYEAYLEGALDVGSRHTEAFNYADDPTKVVVQWTDGDGKLTVEICADYDAAMTRIADIERELTEK